MQIELLDYFVSTREIRFAKTCSRQKMGTEEVREEAMMMTMMMMMHQDASRYHSIVGLRAIFAQSTLDFDVEFGLHPRYIEP
jgi:hypothetical protein